MKYMSDEEEKYRKELNTFQQSLNILKCENRREMWAIIQVFIGVTIFSKLLLNSYLYAIK